MDLPKPVSDRKFILNVLNRFLPLRPNPLIVSEWYQAQGEGELPALANLTKGPRHCKL